MPSYLTFLGFKLIALVAADIFAIEYQGTFHQNIPEYQLQAVFFL